MVCMGTDQKLHDEHLGRRPFTTKYVIFFANEMILNLILKIYVHQSWEELTTENSALSYTIPIHGNRIFERKKKKIVESSIIVAVLIPSP